MTLLNCARDLDWIGCIDFGTTFSKFAMVRAADREELTREDVQALPISIGPDYRGTNEYLLPSVVFVTEDAFLFGEESSRAAIRARDSVRAAFSSPKQYLSTFDIAQYMLLSRERLILLAGSLRECCCDCSWRTSLRGLALMQPPKACRGRCLFAWLALPGTKTARKLEKSFSKILSRLASPSPTYLEARSVKETDFRSQRRSRLLSKPKKRPINRRMYSC